MTIRQKYYIIHQVYSACVLTLTVFSKNMNNLMIENLILGILMILQNEPPLCLTEGSCRNSDEFCCTMDHSQCHWCISIM